MILPTCCAKSRVHWGDIARERRRAGAKASEPVVYTSTRITLALIASNCSFSFSASFASSSSCPMPQSRGCALEPLEDGAGNGIHRPTRAAKPICRQLEEETRAARAKWPRQQEQHRPFRQPRIQHWPQAPCPRLRLRRPFRPRLPPERPQAHEAEIKPSQRKRV